MSYGEPWEIPRFPMFYGSCIVDLTYLPWTLKNDITRHQHLVKGICKYQRKMGIYAAKTTSKICCWLVPKPEPFEK